MIAFPGEVAGNRHTQRRGDRGRGVPGTERIMGALLPVGESAKPAVLANSRKARPAPSEHLVSVALMPHVPHYLVPGAFEGAMQRDSELHHTQVGGEMPAIGVHYGNDPAPHLGGKMRQLGKGKSLQVSGLIDAIQNHGASLLKIGSY